MDRRSFWAIILCFLIFLGWQKFYIEPRTIPRTAPQTAPQITQDKVLEAPAQPPKINQASTPEPKIKKAQITEPQTVTLSLPKGGTVTLSNANAWISNWTTLEPSLTELQTITHQEAQGELAFDFPEYAYLIGVRGELTATDQQAQWKYEDEKIKIERTLSIVANAEWLFHRANIEFKTTPPKVSFLSLFSHSPKDDPEVHDRAFSYWTNNDIETALLNDLSELTDISTPTRWMGAGSRYFFFGLAGVSGAEARALIQRTAEQAGRISFVYPVTGQKIEMESRFFFVPKKLDSLQAIDTTLDHVVDLGWFTFFAYPMLKLLKWLYSLFHNYGLAIIGLTVLVRMAVYPLAYKSAKSMKQMAKLQPQLTKIREKYKNDKEAMNRELLGLMRTQGYNPMSGCLPLLVQMPIFFALYRVLYSAIELYQAPFFWWIKDLSAKDPYFVTPVLLTIVMYLQQKITPTTVTDPVQAKMLQWMPVIFGVFMVTLPSGLTLYMLISALVGILQQVVLNKKLGITPTVTGPAPAAATKPV